MLIDDDGTSEIGRIVYSYDGAGNLVSVTNLAGGVSTFEYDDADMPHHLTAMLDALGRPIARMVFDDEGRMIAHCPAGGDPVTLDGCNRFAFDPDGGFETIFDPRGFRSDLFYDAEGRLVARHDYFNETEFIEQTWTYDAAGNEILYRDGGGGLTTREFDEDGNEIRRILQDGSVWNWEYEGCRNDWVRQCDPLENCFTRAYDASCRLVAESDPLGHTKRFEYSADGFLSDVIDAELQTRSFVYNAARLVTQEIDSLGQSTTFEYNALGQIRRVVDRNGSEREFVFDQTNRLIEERRPGQGVVANWTYNDLSQVTGVSTVESQLTFAYDVAGRLHRVEHNAPDAPTWWLEYEYDASDNLVRIEDSAGGITAYAYDGINRLISVQQSGAGVVEKRVDIEPTASGFPKIIRRYADLAGTIPGPVTTYGYSCESCQVGLTSITHRRPDDSVLLEILYTRNALGQVTAIEDSDGVHGYTWDGAGRLIDEQHPPASSLPSGSSSWDGAGNWLSRPTDPEIPELAYREGGAGHRLLSNSKYLYEYTPAGQLSRREDLNTGELLLVDYSEFQRVRSMTLEDALGQPISSASYVYAMTGWRVQAERDGVSRHFAHDIDSPVFALDNAGNTVWRRLHGRTIDRPLALERAGQLRWLLMDHLGTVRMETDAQSQVLVEYGYDAFGRQVQGPPPTLDDSLRFTGRDFDLPGQLGDFRARIYDPSIGRFISEDPLRPWHYSYAENNPLLFVDPMGTTAAIEYALATCEVIGLAITNSQLGYSLFKVFEAAANAIGGEPPASAPDISGLIPAPSSNADSEEGAGAEIIAKLAIPCGLGNLL